MSGDSLVLRRYRAPWAMTAAALLACVAHGPAWAGPPAAPGGKAAPALADQVEQWAPGIVHIGSVKPVRTPSGELATPLARDPSTRVLLGPAPFTGETPVRAKRELALGSGLLYTADGIIVTNHHLVEKAPELRVVLADGREVLADLLAWDLPMDLALLRIRGQAGDLKPLPWLESGNIRAGDTVYALGNPWGTGIRVSVGIVNSRPSATAAPLDFEDLIQAGNIITAANAGGALVNAEGRVVGVLTVVCEANGGACGGFAVPATLARAVIDQLLKKGTAKRSWLGVTFQELDAALADALGLGSVQGALVTDVTLGSPADDAGIKTGDVIRAFNGETVAGPAPLRTALSLRQPGDKVHFDVFRAKGALRVEVVLGERSGMAAAKAKGGARGASFAGLAVLPPSRALRERFGIAEGVKGLVITAVEEGSTAHAAGLIPGDVVVEINREQVATVAGFTGQFAKADNQALLLVRRKGATLFVVIRK